MSRFVTTLKTDQTDRRTYKLLDDLVLADEDQRTIVVPAGFVVRLRQHPGAAQRLPFHTVRPGGRLRELRRDRARLALSRRASESQGSGRHSVPGIARGRRGSMASLAVLGRRPNRRRQALHQDPDPFGVFFVWGLKRRSPGDA